MVTIGCKSLCHNASMGFDSPTSIYYNPLYSNKLQQPLGPDHLREALPRYNYEYRTIANDDREHNLVTVERRRLIDSAEIKQSTITIIDDRKALVSNIRNRTTGCETTYRGQWMQGCRL